MSHQAYQKAATWAESPRQMEYRLFAQVTLALMEAAKSDPLDVAARVDVLDWNRRVWGALRDDCSSPENGPAGGPCAPRSSRSPSGSAGNTSAGDPPSGADRAPDRGQSHDHAGPCARARRGQRRSLTAGVPDARLNPFEHKPASASSRADSGMDSSLRRRFLADLPGSFCRA